MIIQKAPRQLLYSDPHAYVRKHVLPVSKMCGKCESELVLEMESDLYATKYKGEWHLGFTCLVCGSKRIILKPSESDVSEERALEKWEEVSDEEYASKQLASVERYKLALKEYHEYRAYSMMTMYERADAKSYLPAALPETKPKMDKLVAFYDDILEYYKSQAQVAPVRKPPPDDPQLTVQVGKPTSPRAAMEAISAFISFFAILVGAFMGSLVIVLGASAMLIYSIYLVSTPEG